MALQWKLIPCLFLTLLLFCQCQNDQTRQSKDEIDTSNLIHDLNRALTFVVSEDLFPPPVASRIYAYANVAANEAIAPVNPETESLAKALNDYPEVAPPDGPFDERAALITAYCKVAKHLVYRGFMVDSMYNQALRKYQVGEDAEVRKGKAWGDKLGAAIISWADADGYLESRNMPKYELLDQPYSWEPTQPMYGEALEPHWATHRPFFMDSTSQFRLDLPVAFSTDPDSRFYQECVKVKEMVEAGDSFDIEVAVYWDCNPGPTMVDGHKMQVRKQNTPGGHWMGIHAVLAKQDSVSLGRACHIYAILMAGIADGFIAAWDTKFHHNLLRPETYINRYIDADWKPKLESPLFPEFASAHSAISGVAASILEEAYGKKPFYDETNVVFGLPPREFPDVWVAAREAAKSRLLGGIHYEFGCDEGLKQGMNLGQYILSKT